MRLVFCLVALALVASPVFVEAQAKKKEQRTGAKSPIFQVPSTVTLTAEQQAKWDGVTKEFGPKVATVQEKLNAVLTTEQKKARKDAVQAAKDAGKKGKAAKADIDAALKLTDEQRKQMATAEGEMKELTTQIRAKQSEFLTAEQKEALKPKKKAAK
jgi:hypothetical protein